MTTPEPDQFKLNQQKLIRRSREGGYDMHTSLLTEERESESL